MVIPSVPPGLFVDCSAQLAPRTGVRKAGRHLVLSTTPLAAKAAAAPLTPSAQVDTEDLAAAVGELSCPTQQGAGPLLSTAPASAVVKEKAQDKPQDRATPYCPGELLKRSADLSHPPTPASSRTTPVGGGHLPRLLGSVAISTDAEKAPCKLLSAAAAEGDGGSSTEAEAEEEEPLVASSLELPTKGSALHRAGTCKPCAFVFKGGCQSGVDCKFCHLCQPGEKKRRKKDWKEARKTVRMHAR